jgi:hypothetical protein
VYNKTSPPHPWKRDTYEAMSHISSLYLFLYFLLVSEFADAAETISDTFAHLYFLSLSLSFSFFVHPFN